ncbi:hypothetical protein AVEN_84353-1 [Araneus ventricosus]|uniref:Uncharacterized protein n=1 Tax=Araneus ventricosus TaxID=182803 RepID=A0A4Y2TWU9_ARAVE|nr:hypothetical protein AVEN_84353-1 [Araneus ventricosus]
MPIGGFTSKVKFHDELIPVNPDKIFKRIPLLKKRLMLSYRNISNLLLAPFPLSLFDEVGLRKTRIYATAEDAAKSTKSVERIRRTKKHIAGYVMFDESMSSTMSQEKFLSNDKNKQRLPKRGKAGDALYCAGTLNIAPHIRGNILLLHAFSGCDNTSALFRQGKKKFMNVLNSTEEQQVVNIFCDESECPDDIDEHLSLPLQQLQMNTLSVHTYRFNFGVDFSEARGFWKIHSKVGVGRKPNMDCSQSPPRKNQLLQPFSL